MRNASYLASALLLVGCQATSVPPESVLPSTTQSTQQALAQPPQQPSRHNEVIAYLRQLPRSELEAFFDIDVYKGYHASFQGERVSLIPVQDPFVVQYQRYADELSRGEVANTPKVTVELRRMSRGWTYVGTWDGVPYRLSDADHERPYLRAIRVFREAAREATRFSEDKNRYRRDLRQLRDTQERCDPAMLESLEERMRSLEYQIAEPFSYSKPDEFQENLAFFRRELVERYVDFPQAQEGGVRVVFEAHASRFRRTDTRTRIGAGAQPTLIIENAGTAHFVFRVFSNGQMIDSVERSDQ